MSVSLALSLVSQGHKVGILDIDLTGPSIPRMLRVDRQLVHKNEDGWMPVRLSFPSQSQAITHPLSVMSIAFLLNSASDSVVWRGPKKTAMIRQFLSDVQWGELDYLIIDTPPGTSDEHISLAEFLTPLQRPPSAVLVTTPQAISLNDVMKEINFCRQTGLKMLGLIENMSGYVCPHCSDCTNIFSTKGGESLAKREGLLFLGRLPIDTKLVQAFDGVTESEEQSRPDLLREWTDCPVSKRAEEVVQKMLDGLPSCNVPE